MSSGQPEGRSDPCSGGVPSSDVGSEPFGSAGSPGARVVFIDGRLGREKIVDDAPCLVHGVLSSEEGAVALKRGRQQSPVRATRVLPGLTDEGEFGTLPREG